MRCSRVVVVVVQGFPKKLRLLLLGAAEFLLCSLKGQRDYKTKKKCDPFDPRVADARLLCVS